MKKICNWLCKLIAIGSVLILANSCKKDDNPFSMTDPDGNVYTSVTIGTQVWMVENLKTTKYKDGTAIPLVTDNSLWAGLTTPAYCWFNNYEATYKSTYGAIYNWYTANSGKLCPAGWHVPKDNEWMILSDYLGGGYVAGGKLKESGTAHWISPNTGATNQTGFTGIPTELRAYNGEFYHQVGELSYWWSTTEYDVETAYLRELSCAYSDLFSSNLSKNTGIAVRCVKDN
jgi:uncharacterized protein (TIGR02145 family)